MSRYISFRDFDWLLLIFILMICGLGVMEIHSATLHTKFAGAHIRQVYWIAGGMVGMFLVSLVNYQKLLDRIDELEALEGIKRGLADVEAGRVTPLKEFENEFRSKHGLSGRAR